MLGRHSPEDGGDTLVLHSGFLMGLLECHKCCPCRPFGIEQQPSVMRN